MTVVADGWVSQSRAVEVKRNERAQADFRLLKSLDVLCVDIEDNPVARAEVYLTETSSTGQRVKPEELEPLSMALVLASLSDAFIARRNFSRHSVTIKV